METTASRSPFVTPPPLRWTREVVCAVITIVVLCAFRFWYCAHLGIIADEAYYWLWSKHLAASYYSKGPGIAWTIAFGTQIFGDTAFGIRWLSVVLSAATGWQLFLLARRLYDERTALTAVAVAAVVPLFAIGSVLMTIDPLSVFFWVWAANRFCDALAKDRWSDWIWVGLAVGLGFLAKYVNAIQIVCFIAYLVWTPSQRHHLRSPKALLALVVFAVCLLPVLGWNAQHGWITATHLKERGALQNKFHVSLKPFANFVTMQALVISPLLFIGVLISLFTTLGKKVKTDSEKYLLALLLPIFGFYAVLALNNPGEANWTATGYIGAFVLLVADWRRRCAKTPAWRWAVGAALVLMLVQTALMHETAPLNLSVKKDPLNRTRGWDDFGLYVDAAHRRRPADVLIGNRYQTAALMAWYVPGHPKTYIPNSDHVQNQFSFWPGYALASGSSALFVTDETDRLPVELKQDFPEIYKVAEFWTEFRGRKLKQFYIYYCLRP